MLCVAHGTSLRGVVKQVSLNKVSMESYWKQKTLLVFNVYKSTFLKGFFPNGLSQFFNELDQLKVEVKEDSICRVMILNQGGK